MAEMEIVPLFNGAATISLPQGDFLSASDIRQIPDNQEVFLHRTQPNKSIIVEFLEPMDTIFMRRELNENNVDETDDGNEEIGNLGKNFGARMHFDELADDNDARDIWIDESYMGIKNGDKVVQSIRLMSWQCPVEVCHGTQTISKRSSPPSTGEEEGCKDLLHKVRIWLAIVKLKVFDVDFVITLNVGPPDSDHSGEEVQEEVSDEECRKLFEDTVSSLRLHDTSLFDTANIQDEITSTSESDDLSDNSSQDGNKDI